MNQNKTEEAKDFLREEGFYVDNLWHLDDVQHLYTCDRDTAAKILHRAMTNEAPMEQIWFAIKMAAELDNLKATSDNE